MVKYGMPTLFETKTAEDCARLCRELGLGFAELNANFPQFQTHRLDAGQLRRLTKEYGTEFTVHLDDEMNIGDFNPLVAQAWQQTVRQTVELSRQANIRKLNMHLPRGAVYTLPTGKVYFAQVYEQEYLDGVARFRDLCTQWAGEDVRICVENSGGFLPVNRKALDVLLASPAFGLTWDIGHNHCADRMDEDYFRSHLSKLHHMHIHDAKRPKEDHLPLGTGEIDLPRFLTLADAADATAVLEVKTEDGLRRSVDWLKENKYL